MNAWFVVKVLLSGAVIALASLSLLFSYLEFQDAATYILGIGCVAVGYCLHAALTKKYFKWPFPDNPRHCPER